MTKYVKKPAIIEAHRYQIDPVQPDWFSLNVKRNTIITHLDGTCDVKTLEGIVKADFGDYIIMGVVGDVSVCKPNVFVKSYMDVDVKSVPTESSESNLTFGQAFGEVKKGKGMRLPQWQPDVVIRCQRPDEHSKMTAPYLYVESRFGKVPWKETNIELFAENWEVVE